MLNVRRMKELCKDRKINTEQLAGQIVRGSLNRKQALSAVRNWRKGLFKPQPEKEDIEHLAAALSVEARELTEWQSSYKYAPLSARKAMLVTQLIAGRNVQDAMDILKFTRKRAAAMVDKVLKSAVADADEQQADVDNLYVSKAFVDDAGVRIGTKTWIAKDRGKAHAIRQRACHITVVVAQA